MRYFYEKIGKCANQTPLSPAAGSLKPQTLSQSEPLRALPTKDPKKSSLDFFCGPRVTKEA